MSDKSLYIKNMVCDRCIRTVKDELSKLGLDIAGIKLGVVYLKEQPTEEETERAATVLKDNGFVLLRDKQTVIVEKVKAAIVELVHHSEETLIRVNLSEYLSRRFDLSYKHLSSLFSGHENMTIEKYYIFQKIERAKELLEYGEMNLSEIAYSLGYSSVQHFSSQFKKITGLSPSHYNRQGNIGRVTLDSI